MIDAYVISALVSAQTDWHWSLCYIKWVIPSSSPLRSARIILIFSFSLLSATDYPFIPPQYYNYAHFAFLPSVTLSLRSFQGIKVSNNFLSRLSLLFLLSDTDQRNYALLLFINELRDEKNLYTQEYLRVSFHKFDTYLCFQQSYPFSCSSIYW